MKNKRRKLVCFFGSSIGNFTHEESMRFIREVSGSLGKDDLFLIGFDLKKDLELMTKAYNDSKGVTREFNLNLLVRFNRELSANFDISEFEHLEYFDDSVGAMVSYFGGLLLLPAIHAFSLSHPLALKLAVGLVILYALMLQFGSAVGLHLLSDIEAKVRSRLLAERLRLALGAARQDWFDLNAESGEMTSSNRHVGIGIGSDVTTREERGYRQWLDKIHPDDRPSAQRSGDPPNAPSR